MNISGIILERMMAMRVVSQGLTETLRHALRNSLSFDSPDTEVLFDVEEEVQLPSRVLLYNDEEHTFDEVIFQLMKATGCRIEDARDLAFEVDSRGQAYVFEGEMLKCLGVSSVLEEIDLLTEVEF